MPEDNNTSSSEDARSTTGSPEMGTPEADERSVTKTSKKSITVSVDDFQQEIDELKQALAKANKDAKEHRLKAKELDDIKASQLTEQEKLQAERDALQASNEDLAAELLEHRVNQDISNLASKFNFTLSADLIAKLLDWKEIEWDEENGKPLNIEKLLEKLAKAEPGLVKQQQTPGQPGTPALPAMNPGRSSITQPGGNVPGKIPRLDDIQWTR